MWGALAVLVAVGGALRLRRAWEDMPQLILRTVPDDSFYYFQIARSVMHGRNLTLDGETVTNGFHPLWMALILPIFALDDRHLAVHLALSLGAVLGTATIALMFELTRRLTGNPRAGLLAAGFFAFHPVFIIYAVNGIETSLALFMVTLTTLLFVRAARNGARTTRSLVALGLSAGFMILARIDTALALPAIVLWFALTDRRGAWWRAPLIVGVSGAAVIAPWLIWNLLTFGRLLQDSAIAGDILLREAFFSANGDALDTRLDKGWSETRRYIFERGPREFMVPFRDSVALFWAFACAIPAAMVLLPSRHRRMTIAALGLLSVPFGGFVIALLYETGIRWFVRPWYFAPYAVLAAVGAGVVAHWLEGAVLDAREWLLRRTGAFNTACRRVLAPGLVVVGLYAVLGVGLFYQYGPNRDDALVFGYFWQPAVMEATAWTLENTDESDRIAAYNAGIPSYFSERVVVNLDGVVNYDAYVAARDCTTRDYIAEKDIDYVVDSYGQFVLAGCGLTLDSDLETILVFEGPSPVHITRPVRGN
jgi:hypothetical protein